MSLPDSLVWSIYLDATTTAGCSSYWYTTAPLVFQSSDDARSPLLVSSTKSQARSLFLVCSRKSHSVLIAFDQEATSVYKSTQVQNKDARGDTRAQGWAPRSAHGRLANDLKLAWPCPLTHLLGPELVNPAYFPTRVSLSQSRVSQLSPALWNCYFLTQ